jgi:hypothetical protein
MKMNSIMKSWRSFLTESKNSQETSKLRILDFDDTIANTDEQVKLYTPRGNRVDDQDRRYRLLSSDQFAVYPLREEEYYDESSFYQFNDVDVLKAQPVKAVTRILRNFVNAKSESKRKILILTARNQVAEKGIRNFLKSIEIEDSEIDVVGVGDKSPAAKVRVIDDYINNKLSGVTYVSFFDDSGPNVQAVKSYLDAMDIRNDVARVVEDEKGKTRLLRVEDE